MLLLSEDSMAVMGIWAEGRGECFDGKVGIGEAFRNRMKRRHFSNGTLASTLFWPKQFSCFNTENPWRWQIFTLDNADRIVRECYEAWIKSETSNLTKGAVLYCNLKILPYRPAWAKPEKLLAEIGDHSFFEAN